MNRMKIDFAPMEGVTDYIFRKTFNKYFKGVSHYYTPFLTPAPKRILAAKELKEVLPENNQGMELIPQLLTNNADDFNEAAKKLHEIGYERINLNLGCPSGTVTAKGKGAGFLKDPDKLDEFLERIFENTDYEISIKTRIGVSSTDEWKEILSIYKKYPISELIVHPRLLKEQYRGEVHMDEFRNAYEDYGNKLTFNGDIKTIGDINSISAEFGKMERIMLGRGLLGDPYLPEKLDGNIKPDLSKIIEFGKELFSLYLEEFGNEHATVNRMKGVWFYLLNSFENKEKCAKLIKKSQNKVQLESALMQLDYYSKRNK